MEIGTIQYPSLYYHRKSYLTSVTKKMSPQMPSTSYNYIVNPAFPNFYSHVTSDSRPTN